MRVLAVAVAVAAAVTFAMMGCSAAPDREARIEANANTSRNGRTDADSLDKALVADAQQQNQDAMRRHGPPADYVPSPDEIKHAADLVRAQYRNVTADAAAALARTSDDTLLRNTAKLNGVSFEQLVYMTNEQSGWRPQP